MPTPFDGVRHYPPDRARRQVERLSKDQILCLRELRELLTLEDSSFIQVFPTKDDPLPATEKDVDDFIRRRTLRWRKSWILPVLDALLGAP